MDIKVCKQCNKEFSTYKHNQKFCSQKCCGNSQRTRYITCECCHKIFLGTNMQRRFCSRECYIKSMIGRFISKETRNKLSKLNTGRKCSEETKRKLSKINLGKKPSTETRLKLSEIMKRKMAKYSNGRTKENIKIRKSVELRLWREAVFARDNWTCQECGERGGILNAHHIQNFSQHSELRTAIDNGITLCKRCHQKRHKLSFNHR